MTAAIVLAILAVLPLVMTVLNTRLLRTPGLPASPPSVAILIPARDEEASIGGCVRAALASSGASVEVIVLDDGSSDGTAAIVETLARQDARLKLASGPPLPAGWNGKQHACWVLSTLTDRPNLLFLDADVVLAPEAAARLAPNPGVDLVSGVPQQKMGSAIERMGIPMINTLLLGYLPVGRMRRTKVVALAAGCGQMMMVRAAAYRAMGGHGAIRQSLHDGLKLPRAFRAAGFTTDLVNGAELGACRMYASPGALWTGFLKNATEGMARPMTLPVWTVLLFGGHVLPWLALVAALAGEASTGTVAVLAFACVAPLLARLIQARLCREPAGAILFHPFGILLTLAIQWTALVRRGIGRTTEWRGRAYMAEN